MSTQYDSVWSPEYINTHPLPKVSRHLLPWLIKDRREAETGSTFYNSETKQHDHDRQGLEFAERELRRIKSDLATEKPDSQRAIILSRQAEGQQERVDFWRGKCYLLDKIIEETKKQQ